MGQTVKFDGIISNFGNHFNTADSTFTCPYHGTYLFSLNLIRDYTGLCVAIMRDEEELAHAFAYENGFTAGALIVVECNVGQEVNAQATCSTDVWLGDRRNQFTGYLLNRF